MQCTMLALVDLITILISLLLPFHRHLSSFSNCHLFTQRRAHSHTHTPRQMRTVDVLLWLDIVHSTSVFSEISFLFSSFLVPSKTKFVIFFRNHQIDAVPYIRLSFSFHRFPLNRTTT